MWKNNDSHGWAEDMEPKGNCTVYKKEDNKGQSELKLMM